MERADDNLASNIEEFFERHGTKGFLILYLQYILMEMYRVGAHSARDTGRSPLTDMVYQYLFTENGEARPPDEVASFDEQVEARCLELAEEIVGTLNTSFLKEMNALSDDFNQDSLKDLNYQLQKAIRKHLKTTWGS